MDDTVLTAISDAIKKADPSTLFRLSGIAADEAAAIANDAAKRPCPHTIELIKAAVEFGYSVALEDIKYGKNESYGYSYRDV
ncbi:hypothetical protein [Natronoglycomyces albus]|uniref:Uncharacterized protein n=1 Tax=Natronoglycomyces albus TaxID=2811108 RepID=A0A895XJV7_9ACTN|nr:hypothetical protein [Natronoglycomyces albus]QSB06041.1 hypothetical protein JQS30_03710 [Natronoglycomyces albus]